MTTTIGKLLEGDTGRYGTPCCTLEATALVDEAARRMKERRHTALVVTQDRQLAGIVTRRDILERVITAPPVPRPLTIAEVMTRELITAPVHTSIDDAMSMMTRHRIRHLPLTRDDRLAWSRSKT